MKTNEAHAANAAGAARPGHPVRGGGRNLRAQEHATRRAVLAGAAGLAGLAGTAVLVACGVSYGARSDAGPAQSRSMLIT